MWVWHVCLTNVAGDTLTVFPRWTRTLHPVGAETVSGPLWLNKIRSEMDIRLNFYDIWRLKKWNCEKFSLTVAKAFLSSLKTGKMLYYLVYFVTTGIEPLTSVIKPPFRQTKRLLMPRHWNNITLTEHNEGCWLKRAMRDRWILNVASK